MTRTKVIRKNNEEVGKELIAHVQKVYDGSIVTYCNVHGIDYSGMMKAVSGAREYSEQQVAPILWDKKSEIFFEKQITIED
tara:strand:+ start:21059 stop:21301 length:243 start_codon:yes stop_codon:yes gene_type:complete